ncbi:cell division protein FtsK [Lysinibacillus sp. 2017]|uniref:FtsK/SpoIIIE family DNA translocase n=1 Tax=unclassified Lysinibacillus TaxID=2636778 RepID=UPI000D528D8A|nr:DNA translocase FtsK [Lysinibacillus sp. 2017]AWE06733.1 cell division protein FtsK [Lysinibacillus sp. 2017]TGN37456.1 DNA translocase FtsK [Lysinibacillus sp. S2017]
MERKTKNIKAKSKPKPKTKAKNSQKELHPLAYEIIGLLLIAFAIIEFLELGFVGKWTHSITLFLLGNLHFLVPLLCFLIAGMLMVRRRGVAFKSRIVYGVLFVGASLTIFSHSMLFEQLYETNSLISNSVLKETWRILISNDGITNRSNALGGGMIGGLLFSILHVLFDSAGTKIAATVFLAIGAILITGKAMVPILFDKMPSFKGKIKRKKRVSKPAPKEPKNNSHRYQGEQQEEEAADEEQIIITAATQNDAPIISNFVEQVKNEKQNETKQVVEDTPIEELNLAKAETEHQSEKPYLLPSIQLLKAPPEHDQSGEFSVIQSNAKKLEQTFASFGVKAKVTQVHLGPAVTKYEVMPDTGVKVSKIVSLQDDLALALAAKDIRIEAPIPGKSAVGIEVPNSEVAIVTLREVIEANDQYKPDSKLLVSLGRDVTGQAISAELNKMPHLLVAGSTGSGKSVCINDMIVSLIMRAKPSEVRMMMIDPKMVELSVYNGIPHLLAPVVTDARKAAQALQKVVSEMERRYDLFSMTGTRNIEGYNEHIMMHNEDAQEKQPKLPYIVVIVDELADLMMVASHEVEDAITRLAQMARAAGIHLIIATQRPSVDVITGIIKANIPSRIAFAVSSAVDSRTILDMGGAERLLGRGDMLYLPAGSSKPVRVQGAFVSDHEVEKVIASVIEQQKAQYEEEMIPTDEPVVDPLDETDELYEDAVQLVLEMQTASVSLLQRRFRIGYSRAARIVDQMEQRGIVGPPEGSKPRQVLNRL